MPPGPARLPLIGNLLDIPKGYNWLHWAKYTELYGPISSISVMGQTLIILNDHKSSTELLEGRSLNYSDRPTCHFANVYSNPSFSLIFLLFLSCNTDTDNGLNRVGFSQATSLLPYDSVLTMHRKHMRRFIGTNEAISQLHPIEEFETRRFISRVLRRPEQLQEHIRL